MECTRLLAVRHGETAWNRDTRIQGHTNIGLSEHGRWQARRLAQALRDEPLAAVYASDLSRAFDTACEVAAMRVLPCLDVADGVATTAHPPRLEVQADPGLRERSFGRFEGQTWAELEARWPQEALAWRKRVPDFAPPGGESLLALRERVVATVHRLARRHAGEQILLVAHGGVLDILYRAATRLDLQAPRSWELPNTGINRLLWTPEGLSLVGWGDVGHLQGDVLDEASAT